MGFFFRSMSFKNINTTKIEKLPNVFPAPTTKNRQLLSTTDFAYLLCHGKSTFLFLSLNFTKPTGMENVLFRSPYDKPIMASAISLRHGSRVMYSIESSYFPASSDTLLFM